MRSFLTWCMILAAVGCTILAPTAVTEAFMGSTHETCARVTKGDYPQISLSGIIDETMCAEIIREAEAHAAVVGGWETTRHEDYPTTDFDTADIPALKYPIENITYSRIIPQIARAYGLDPLKLGINEVFIAKYSAETGNQRLLKPHVDGADFSFVLALNHGFRGGGTKFAGSNDVQSPRTGDATGFCGQSEHQGLEVTAGTRYVLAGFLWYGRPEGCEGLRGA